jgi:DNA-binding NarL/FixJ family response regulator
MKPTKVVLADDHSIVRKSIRNFLEASPEIEVVGEASNGLEAIDAVNHLAPDVLLLDMEMPVLSGIGVVRKLAATKSPVRILALSAYDDDQYIHGVLENGATGYLTKDEAPRRVVDAVRRVARGEKGLLSKRVLKRLSYQ